MAPLQTDLTAVRYPIQYAATLVITAVIDVEHAHRRIIRIFLED